MAIFAVIFLQERPALKDWLGIALVAAGVVLLGLKKYPCWSSIYLPCGVPNSVE